MQVSSTTLVLDSACHGCLPLPACLGCEGQDYQVLTRLLLRENAAVLLLGPFSVCVQLVILKSEKRTSWTCAIRRFPPGHRTGLLTACYQGSRGPNRKAPLWGAPTELKGSTWASLWPNGTRGLWNWCNYANTAADFTVDDKALCLWPRSLVFSIYTQAAIWGELINLCTCPASTLLCSCQTYWVNP